MTAWICCDVDSIDFDLFIDLCEIGFTYVVHANFAHDDQPPWAIAASVDQLVLWR